MFVICWLRFAGVKLEISGDLLCEENHHLWGRKCENQTSACDQLRGNRCQIVLEPSEEPRNIEAESVAPF